MPVVKFVNEKKEIEVADGANLRQEALKAGINLYFGLNGIGAGLNSLVNCYGFGMCGSCRVVITKGIENASPMGTLEKIKFTVPAPDPLPALAFIGHEKDMRLACQTTVHGDMEVLTNPQVDLFGENFFS